MSTAECGLVSFFFVSWLIAGIVWGFLVKGRW